MRAQKSRALFVSEESRAHARVHVLHPLRAVSFSSTFRVTLGNETAEGGVGFAEVCQKFSLSAAR